MDSTVQALKQFIRQPPPAGRKPVAVARDSDLIVRAADGDREAFDELYRRFERPVIGLALRRLSDRGRAEDATQETFAAIWRSARTYRPNRGPGAPWLFTVARNAIVDQTRRRVEPPAEPRHSLRRPRPCRARRVRMASRRVHCALEALPRPNER